jgi:hypothetical protein
MFKGYMEFMDNIQLEGYRKEVCSEFKMTQSVALINHMDKGSQISREIENTV